jgi:hypothetical protein
MMPFNGELPGQNKYNKYLYHRLKYNIERINAKGAVVFMGKEFHFDVSVFLAETGSIPEDALQEIRDRDIGIGVISETNVNVIYELAVRITLRPELILIVLGRDAEQYLPIYLQDMGHIVVGFASKDEAAVEQVLRDLANADGSAVGGFEENYIPFGLRKVIDDGHDRALETSLTNALKAIVSGQKKQPSHIYNLMENLDPSRLLMNADSYYPSCVTKYTFLARDAKQTAAYLTYKKEDLYEPPFLCDWNSKFLDLMGFAGWDRRNPLTDDVIFANLSRFVDKKYLDPFISDQDRVERDIIFGPLNGVAKVPIRFNKEHPNENYRGKAVLPCSAIKRRVGNIMMTHYLYILVIFFDVTHNEDFTALSYNLGTQPPGEAAPTP